MYGSQADREGMAPKPSYFQLRMERTGVAEIDRLIDAFIAEDPTFEELVDEDDEFAAEAWYGPLSEMRDPVIADGFCTQVAAEFADFLAGHGLDARSSEEMDSALPGHPFSGLSAHTPQAFGITPTRSNGMPTHAATVVVSDKAFFSVDFTAAQYGDTSEWPLVQRWDGTAWQRTW